MTWHPNSLHALCAHIDRDMFATHVSEPPPPPHTPPPHTPPPPPPPPPTTTSTPSPPHPLTTTTHHLPSPLPPCPPPPPSSHHHHHHHQAFTQERSVFRTFVQTQRRRERTRLRPAETGTPSPGLAPSREDDGGHGGAERGSGGREVLRATATEASTPGRRLLWRWPSRRPDWGSTVASAMSSFWPSMSLCCRWWNSRWTLLRWLSSRWPPLTTPWSGCGRSFGGCIGRKKKKGKRRLPRSPRPRLVSGCCLRSTRARPRLLRTAWFYSGYKFLPRSRRLFGTNSTFFLRDGGARAVRTWKPGLFTSQWYLAPTCSLPVRPEEHKKTGVSERRLHDLISTVPVSGSHLCGACLLISTEIRIFLGFDFRTCFRTQRLCLVRQWIQFRAVCGFFQRMLWFDSGYIFCVSVRAYSAQFLVRQWIHGLRHIGHSSEPLVSDSHLFGVRWWSTGLWSFLEDDFRMDSVSSSCLFNTGYMSTSVYGGFYGSDCRKLRKFRSCSSSRSSTFPSWCRGIFSWSCCSADHSYSPAAVLERGDRCPWWQSCRFQSLPVVCNDIFPGYVCCSSTRSSAPCRRAEADPLFSRPWRYSSCLLTQWPMSLLCRRTGSHGQVVDVTVVLPQFLLVDKIVVFVEVVDIPVVTQRLSTCSR